MKKTWVIVGVLGSVGALSAGLAMLRGNNLYYWPSVKAISETEYVIHCVGIRGSYEFIADFEKCSGIDAQPVRYFQEICVQVTERAGRCDSEVGKQMLRMLLKMQAGEPIPQ